MTLLGLGIESTAHTFSCAILRDDQILSDVRSVYRPPDGQGIHPREASRHHVEEGPRVLSKCLAEAGVRVGELDLISYAAGPGLGPCLRVGAVMARALSSYHLVPIYPVHHAIGHIDLGMMLTGAADPLALLVSGGHTMILAFLSGQWRVFGETLDITLGQLLDQFGRSIGFASPCGRDIERLAGTASRYHPLPYSVRGNDVSFSGLLSAAKSAVKPAGRQVACYSLQETAFAMIAEAVERALSLTGKTELMVVGGVAANRRLSEMLEQACGRHGCGLFPVPVKYAGDCGSQIARTGMLESRVKGPADIQDTFVRQSWRLDSVAVGYMSSIAS